MNSTGIAVTVGNTGLDYAKNEDGIKAQELLVVSFGTSSSDSRGMTIGAIEQALEDAFGAEYTVRRSFTSQIVIDHIKKLDGTVIDNVPQALERAEANGVRTLVLQPTYLTDGLEFQAVVGAAERRAHAFGRTAIGKPLLSSDRDYRDVMAAIAETMAEYDDGDTAICLMGHGTKAESNAAYEKLQGLLTENGYEAYYVGTIKASPTLEDVLAKVREGNYRRVVLRPLMIAAGKHADDEMAGDGEDSWKSRFQSAGYEVVCVPEGLGEIPAIRDIFVRHAQAAMDAL